MPARRLTEHLQREIPPGHTLREGITGAETGKASQTRADSSNYLIRGSEEISPFIRDPMGEDPQSVKAGKAA
jgi:hypothetical protein